MAQNEQIQDWLKEHIRSQIEPLTGHQNSSAQSLLRSLWPLCEPYFSPLNPTFAMLGFDQAQLYKKKTWLLRDGILPTTWLLNSLDPEDVKGTLLVHSSIESLIPPEWLKKVKCYQVQTRERQELQKPEALIIASILSGICFDRDELVSELDRIEASIKTLKLGKIPIYVYLPFRYNEIGENDHKLHSETLVNFVRRFDQQLTFVDYSFFENTFSMHKFLYHEINTSWIYTDSYLTHYCLSRGAQFLIPPVDKSAQADSLSVTASPYHSIVVYAPKVKTRPEMDDSLMEKYFSITTGFTNIKRFDNKLWPEWFSRYLKNVMRNSLKR